jgi:hypothetical protein
MSVWASDTQKTDLVKEVYQISPELVNSIFGCKLSPYLNPDPDTSGLEKDSSWEDLAIAMGWNDSVDLEDTYEELKKYLEGVHAYHVGTQGVYKLIGACRLGRFTTGPQYDYERISATLATFRDLLCPSTQITPKAFTDRYCRRDETCTLVSRKYEGLSECFKRMRVLYNKTDYEEVRQERFFGAGHRDYTVVRAGRLLFLRGTREYTNTCIVLTRGHLDQVVGCSQRIANIYAYLGSYLPENALGEAMAYVDFTIETAAAASRPNSYKVARAFHKARQLMQMETLGSVLPEGIASELADYRSDGLDDILRLSKYQAILRSFRLVHRVELMHVYKWMPPPDFDATSAFGVVKKYHMAPRPSGADPDAKPAAREMWSRIVSERKLHIAHAFHRMTGQWPPNMTHSQSGVTLKDTVGWDVAHLLPYYTLGTDVASQIKDKQTVCASMLEEMGGRARADQTNYLLWYMANKDNLDTDRIRTEYPYHGEDNYARVAYKPEAHKPDSRLFYMAPPKIRTILGELEGNLSNVAKFYPGCLMGKSTSERKKILLDLMDPHSKLPGLDVASDYEVFIIQFDLSKFSPKSNYNVTHDYHKFWARVYGTKEIETMTSIGCNSTILHTTCGLKMHYVNKGADLEGFRGRLMTMFHADLLGTACRVAKERGITVGKAKLAVFIDDGAVKIAVKGLGEEAIRNVRAFLAVMQEVYAAAGQDANPSKTCISRVGGEMLAEFYVHGTQMPTGIKAAMRLYPDYENAAMTITEEFDTLFSTCQGSVKDGGDWLTIHHMYVEACLKSINRWARREIANIAPHTLALLLMTPKSYGGFGIQPLQGLVTTACTNLTAEGLAMLNRAARWLPGYRTRVMKIVMTPVIVREPLSILRDPLRVRADTPVLMENRLTMAVVDWLGSQQGSIGAYMGEYNSASLKEHATKVAEALMASDSISVPVIERAWKATPLCQVETLISKFKRSHTVIRFIGREGLSKIRRSNMGDLRRVLERAI